MYSAQPMLRGGRSGSEKNEYAQQQPVAAHATPSAVQPVQSPSGQYPVFPQQMPYGYPAMYGYASMPVPTNAPVSASATLPVNQIPAFQSMQSGYYQMAPTAQHISQQQQQQQQFYPINDYGTQFYQFAQPQPDSASVPLYSHNQMPFYSHPPAFFSQPAVPAPTPIPVQPQFCSGTPSSENALHHNQPNQQQQPFVVPVQQIGHYTNQPPYKPAGVPLHASTPLNGSEWGQSEKEFEQKSTASSVQPGSGQSAQGAMRNVASGSCISAIYASDDDLFGSGQSVQPQMQLQTLSLNQALQQPPHQPFQTLHTQANHHLPPPGFDYTQQGYRYSLPGSTLPIQSPSSGSNLHNQTANSCDATVISTQQPLPAQQSTLTALNYSGPRANIHRPNPNFSLHRRSDLVRNRGIGMNGMERRMEGMRLDDRAGGNGPNEQGRADMARNEWKGRLTNGNANANGQEGFRQFNGNRNPFRQVTSRVQSAGFRTDVCYKFRDNAFCPNGDACRFLHLDAHGNPTNVNQNWGQTTKGSGDSGLSSEDNSNPSGWRQGGQTDRHGQAERNGRNGPSAGRGNNHNNRPWLPQAQGQYRPFNNRQQQQQAQPQAQGNQPSRQSHGEGRAAQGRPDVGGRGGLERNQGQSQAQRGEYRPNTRYGAPPIQHTQNGNQSEGRPQLQRQAANH